MRDFFLLMLTMAIGYTVGLFDHALGASVVILIVFLSTTFLQQLKLSKQRKLREIVFCKLRELDNKADEPSVKLFWWKVRGIRVSTAQLVFHSYDSDKDYWIVCGSWWFGCLSKRFKIYLEQGESLLNYIREIFELKDIVY